MGLISDIAKAYITKGASGAKKKKPKPAESDIDNGPMDSYAKGGIVRKTGPARLHKGERVLTKRQSKRYRKSASKR